MLVVPTKAIPNQTLQVQLAGQSCTINVYQLAYGLFVDLFIGDTLIVAGVIAENLNRIVRGLYLGFVGDLVFFDASGAGADPVYTELGVRFVLVYLEASELPAVG